MFSIKTANHLQGSKKDGRRTLWRPVLSAAVILFWFTLGGVGGPYFGKVSEVTSNDPAAYLPESAEATAVQQELQFFKDSSDVPAVVVFTSADGFNAEQIENLETVLQASVSASGIESAASPVFPSEDLLAAQAFVPIPSELNTGAVVSDLLGEFKKLLPPDVDVFVTGPAGFSADLLEAFSGIDGLLLVVALIAVFVILIFVYRSFILPVVVLATSVFALTAALFSVWWLAKWEILILNGQTQGILFILVIGAATDYSLLLVARFREELRVERDRFLAVSAALKGAFPAIVASGGTVIAGLLVLLLSDLKSNSGLGPVAAVGILFAMTSALSLLPALLYVFGAAVFWPRIPKPDVTRDSSVVSDSVTAGFWPRVARMIKRNPRPIWVVTAIVLMFGAVLGTQINAVGVPQSELVLGSSQSRDGQEALGEHFPGGSGSPVYIVLEDSEAAKATDLLLAIPAVENVREGGVDENNRILLEATLNVAADSLDAQDAVLLIRDDFKTSEIEALVGGQTAISLDSNASAIRDRNLIIPIVLLAITLILMLLLRSVLAPLLLIATTVLSFGTAMGVSAVVFNSVLKLPGADPAVPLYGFIFLVALGIDYNIFLMTRVREESIVHGTRPGILRGLTLTGSVITSAGVVLAATFAALSVLPILFLLQLAFIVSFGVLLDTFVVRSLLVPALTYDIGPAIWWPSKLATRSSAKDSQ